MDLDLYLSLWTFTGTLEEACQKASKQGFGGIEGSVPVQGEKRQLLSDLLERQGLSFIAEVTTAGSYVPERNASLADHLKSFEEKVAHSMELAPKFVTCLGGCDAWELEESVEFFGKALDIAKSIGVTVCFETHRGRSLFNPWAARRICEQVPQLELTCDFSHWCVVCERLLDTEAENLAFFFKRARHIHARVGFDQGPQVADPAADIYKEALARHLEWWRAIWLLQKNRGFSCITMTPEFGPDGYQMRDPYTGKMLGDIGQSNCWMADTLRAEFETFVSQNISIENHGIGVN